MQKVLGVVFGAVLALGTGVGSAGAATWFPLGPYGGDARSIAADPQNSQHLFMGTATGWIYESSDGGTSWKRLSLIAKRDDLVVQHILVDPLNAKHLTVGAYIITQPDGGLYESQDGGLTWYSQAEMRGQSVRGLAASPSNPKMMVAGTLKGVYRTDDSGLHWKLISPEGSTEIHEVESIAIDPVDPNTIYAGTWHLPWKTVDGGAHWTNIKQGIIDDSDVFSIIVDPKSSQTVYASACSGIYKSVDAGGKFVKIQGIPSTARRTRKLLQDPGSPETVYAGTTEGLYRTLNGGHDFARLTGPEVIVNDVFVDPSNSKRVLLATDRAGVLASEDGGVSFTASNTGFSARQVTAFAADPNHPSTIYAGVVNDKAAGGVFMSQDGGVKWQQQSTALGGRDVFGLGTTRDGVLLAGTGHGIFRLESGAWAQSGTMEIPAPPQPAVEPKKSAAVAARKGAAAKTVRPGVAHRAVVRKLAAKPLPPPAPVNMDTIVYAIVPAQGAMYAGTAQGLMKADADGRVWKEVSSLVMPETRYVAAQKKIVLVANMKRLAVSADEGDKWDALALPHDLTQISAIEVDELGNLWVGGREGLYYSSDYGTTWKIMKNLYVTQVTGIHFDAAGHRLLVTSDTNTTSFAATLPDYKVTYWDSGWQLTFVRPAGDHMVGGTLYDGIVVQPVMVDSKMAGTK